MTVDEVQKVEVSDYDAMAYYNSDVELKQVGITSWLTTDWK